MLSGDEPQGIRAVLGYCYTFNYRSWRIPTSDVLKEFPEDVRLSKACKTMLLHLHAIIIADKYTVEGLKDEAFNRFKTTLVQDDNFNVNAFIVEHVCQAYDPAQEDDVSLLA